MESWKKETRKRRRKKPRADILRQGQVNRSLFCPSFVFLILGLCLQICREGKNQQQPVNSTVARKSWKEIVKTIKWFVVGWTSIMNHLRSRVGIFKFGNRNLIGDLIHIWDSLDFFFVQRESWWLFNQTIVSILWLSRSKNFSSFEASIRGLEMCNFR